MPLKITALKNSIPDRIDALRKTIKDGEGLTVGEVASHPSVLASYTQVTNVLRDKKWSVKTFEPGKNRSVIVLVNPRELAKPNGGGK